MKYDKQSTKHSASTVVFSSPDTSKSSVSSARLCGYNKKSFETTMKDFWKQVAGFSCKWCEGWDESFAFDRPFSKDERAVTFVMSIKTETEGEIESGRLYMLHNTRDNGLSAVGFIDRNDGYVQEYTAEEITNALKTVFDEYN